jgi:hypothetical protein
MINVPDIFAFYSWEILLKTTCGFSAHNNTCLFSCLAAYENPGVQLPESIITWVAIRGMPDYMNNLR